MSLQNQIDQNFLAAFKERRAEEVSTLRMLKAALANKKIEKKMAKDGVLSDEEILVVINSEIKKRRDSIEAYQDGGRDDLALKEKAEIVILEKFLPPAMSKEELQATIGRLAGEIGAEQPADFGKLMGAVMAAVKNQADGQLVAGLVKEFLTGQSSSEN